MSDKKISELPLVTGLTGNDVFPVVQAGSTRGVTAAILRNGMASAPVYKLHSQLVPGENISGYNIIFDFTTELDLINNVANGIMTNFLLSDYVVDDLKSVTICLHAGKPLTIQHPQVSVFLNGSPFSLPWSSLEFCGTPVSSWSEVSNMLTFVTLLKRNEFYHIQSTTASIIPFPQSGGTVVPTGPSWNGQLVIWG